MFYLFIFDRASVLFLWTERDFKNQGEGQVIFREINAKGNYGIVEIQPRTHVAAAANSKTGMGIIRGPVALGLFLKAKKSEHQT